MTAGNGILVSRRAAFAPPRADRGDVGGFHHLLGMIRLGSQLDQGMEGNRHPWAQLLVLLHEIGIDAADDGLVADDQNILAPLQLHDDGLESDDDIAIRLAASVAVVVLVFVAGREILGEGILDFLVGHTIADTGVELVKGFPLQLVVVLGKVTCRRDGTLEGGGPNCQGAVILRERSISFPGRFSRVRRGG